MDPIAAPMIAAAATTASGVGGSEYGFTRSGGTQFHNGFDWRSATGTDVLAAGDGTLEVGYNNLAGNFVKVTFDNGYSVSVSHLSETYGATGDRVEAGQVLGRTGVTGNARNSGREPHGHVVTRNGPEYLDTCNPRDFLSKDGGGGSC